MIDELAACLELCAAPGARVAAQAVMVALVMVLELLARIECDTTDRAPPGLMIFYPLHWLTFSRRTFVATDVARRG